MNWKKLVARSYLIALFAVGYTFIAWYVGLVLFIKIVAVCAMMIAFMWSILWASSNLSD